MVPSLRSDENPVPNVTSYHKVKAFNRGTVSYFVGHGGNKEFHIVDLEFI